MPVTAKNQHRIESNRAAAPIKTTSASSGPEMNDSMTEEEKIAAMFQAGGEQWEQQQQQMANQKAIHRTGYQKPVAVPDKPLPPGYTCHRCGEKGHWIQACPTNNDPNFDGRPKFRRTTGIPRSFLKVVEKPAALAEDGSVDVSKLPPGVMYNSQGEWVVAEPDKAAWEKFQAKNKAAAEKTEAAPAGSQELRDRGLECPIDNRLFVDPVKTPCCGKTFCRDCIENALLGNDFVCPDCSSDNVLVDNLVPDEDTVAKIKAYDEEKAQAKKEKEKTASPVPEKKSTPPGEKEKTKSPSVKPVTAAVDGTTPAPGTPQSTKSESKKRPADEELPNPRIPTGPAAMRKAQSQTPGINGMQNQQGMYGFNPMMGMPFPNGMMGMPMGMNPMMGMPNPMMMNGGWNGMGNMGFPQNNMYGGGFNPTMGGYGQQWQGNQGWGMGGSMNGMPQQQMQQGMQQLQQQQNGNGFAPNQMRAGINGAEQNDEGDAYFRKPVNPHRHQARNRRQRSVDYQQL